MGNVLRIVHNCVQRSPTAIAVISLDLDVSICNHDFFASLLSVAAANHAAKQHL
jgi:hypothetical protein